MTNTFKSILKALASCIMAVTLTGFKAQAADNIDISYRVKVAGSEWTSPVQGKATAGTTGKGLAIEAINIFSTSEDFTLEYQVHVSNLGDMPVTEEGKDAGATVNSQPIEAIRIVLKDAQGNESKDYKVNYRTHVKDIGWTSWVSNGAWSGTKGEAKHIEAIEIYIEEAVSGQAVVDYAKGFLGTPYLWGGTTPSGFDCSGYVQYVYKNFGISLPRTTYEQVKAGVEVSRDSLQIGDLVFTSAGHVGIYVGNNQMLHAPRSGDVIKVSNIWSFYKARRVL